MGNAGTRKVKSYPEFIEVRRFTEGTLEPELTIHQALQYRFTVAVEMLK